MQNKASKHKHYQRIPMKTTTTTIIDFKYVMITKYHASLMQILGYREKYAGQTKINV